jgi:twitching motility two-component system response regulator PilH
MDLYDKIKQLFGWGTKAQAKPSATSEQGTQDHETAAERRTKARNNARSGTRMLVVDDSATIVALLGRMLRQNGYEVLEALDAESGIELARSKAPELIFLDIVLPGMDGFAALRQLRRDPLTRDIPIIMISGNEQATEQFYVHRIGADDFMKKPFARAEVFARIERLLDAHHVPKRLPPMGGAAAAAVDEPPAT